jgi:hypothetical protein
MARFYADEGFPRPIVDELRRQGHDIQTAQEAGKAGQKIPDTDVLAFAISQDRAVLTRNRRHFIRLHSQTRRIRESLFARRTKTSWAKLPELTKSLLRSETSKTG